MTRELEESVEVGAGVSGGATFAARLRQYLCHLGRLGRDELGPTPLFSMRVAEPVVQDVVTAMSADNHSDRHHSERIVPIEKTP